MESSDAARAFITCAGVAGSVCSSTIEMSVVTSCPEAGRVHGEGSASRADFISRALWYRSPGALAIARSKSSRSGGDAAIGAPPTESAGTGSVRCARITSGISPT